EIRLGATGNPLVVGASAGERGHQRGRRVHPIKPTRRSHIELTPLTVAALLVGHRNEHVAWSCSDRGLPRRIRQITTGFEIIGEQLRAGFPRDLERRHGCRAVSSSARTLVNGAPVQDSIHPYRPPGSAAWKTHSPSGVTTKSTAPHTNPRLRMRAW